ncbi:MAG: DNA polymerase III subunit beta [Clostridiales bacterium]|nr:DNA polymerase III subunit beta [Clostridiales bacterium]
MKVICNGLDLAQAVMKVSKALSQRTPNPILENIKLTAQNDTLRLIATDLDLTIEDTIRADVEMEGETLVNGRFFAEYTRKMTEGQIELNLADGNLFKIRYQDSASDVRTQNVDEYPAIHEIDQSIFFSMPQKEFRDLISKVVFSVADDDVRPILQGVLFEIEDKTITAVALDGYRLARCQKSLNDASASMSMIVPARSLEEVVKLLDDKNPTVTVFRQRNLLKIDIGSAKVMTRLLEGDFINYKQILPTEFLTEVTVNKKQFEDSLERASLLTRHTKSNQVRLDLKGAVMQISSDADFASINERVAIKLEGKDIFIAFNVRFLTEALKAINEDFVKIKFNKPESPCVITSVGEGDYLFLILPIRVKG